ncbi:MAG: SsrA-binding protein [Bacteroidetes bacterium GWF2_38_335]|nr:MAG: SsrA-binding protein [Bacteroidetes bacterium GWF2_38_335]OFY78781.1 MAG: SsrA-binding protein [Bacteroidetes bacterium RIFOXYA12_FULL_38_20]HBS85175.1 SsrA-binding protein [Bacteroidales bacterium]
MAERISYKNKKAYFEYEFIDRYTAGIVLTGTEIKSIRDGKVSFTDAYCLFENRELWLRGLHISEYKEGSYNNHLPKRERKLLLNRRELNKLEGKIKEKGLTIIPIILFIGDKGLAKMEIALARGKAEFDKRESIKKKDSDREIDRLMKR